MTMYAKSSLCCYLEEALAESYRVRWRRVWRLPLGDEVSLTADDAERIARGLAESRGWTWLEPVRVARRRRFLFFGRVTFEVRSNADRIGANAVVEIDAESGDMRRSAFIAR